MTLKLTFDISLMILHVARNVYVQTCKLNELGIEWVQACTR